MSWERQTKKEMFEFLTKSSESVTLSEPAEFWVSPAGKSLLIVVIVCLGCR